MAEPFLGEIRLMSFNFAPAGYAACDGSILPVSSNSALASLLGSTFGGDGISTFALPDLRGRMPIHVGSGYILGEAGGEEAHALAVSEIPTHNHSAMGSTSAATTGSPAGMMWATGTKTAYTSQLDGSTVAAMNPAAIAATGTGAGHANLPPYMPLLFCIAISGYYPSRS